MLRRYLNKQSNNLLIVDEKHIIKTIRVIDMLMIPKDYKNILDKRIEFIKDKTFTQNEIENYLFITKDNLSNDLKGLFEFYFGSIACFLYDEELGLHLYDYTQFRKELIKSLENSLEECLKEKIKPSQFLVKETYQGIVLYDPEIPTYKDEWELVEKIAVA